jgi:anti-sigma factor RsiW
MTHNKTNTPNDALHQEVWELLPWYVNGTLAGQELQRVETHLTLCLACQAELTRCRGLATAVQMADEVAWEPSDEHMARIFARIDAAEAPPTPVRRWWQVLQEGLRQGRAMLLSTPSPMRWAFAAQGALVVLLAGMLVWRTPSPPKLYPTLSSATPEAARVGQQIRLVFADDMTERELRTLLRSVGGTIANGPSPVGAYTVEIVPSAPVDSVLAMLRAHQKVRLAEPIVTR